MANVVFDIFLSRKDGGDLRGGETAPGLNLVRDSGASGRIRGLLLCSSTTSGNDLDKALLTVAACKAASGYSEYSSATGYPAMSARPKVPQFAVTKNTTAHRAEVATPAAPNNLLSFGTPTANSPAVRYVLIFEQFSDTDDTLNVPIIAIDEGTVIGQNGSAAQLPMNFAWGSRVMDLLQG